MDTILHPRVYAAGSQAQREAPGRWRLSIAATPAGHYRGAQVDDYMHLPRSKFCWTAPVGLELRARVSEAELPGTWGFGFWNDPFNVSLGLGGAARRLPALPNTAWFFYASPPNTLSLRDTHPAQGLLAATFAAPALPAPLLALGAPLLPLLAWPVTARLLRRMARWVVQEDAAQVNLDPTTWHNYRIDIESEVVTFTVDGSIFFATKVVPRGKMGLVMWIDNQYMAFPPDGKLRFGTLDGSAAWMELKRTAVHQP